MAPSKKADDKAKDIPAISHVSVAEFLEVRNTVVTGLSTLQSALSDLSRSYIAHTNNLIGRSSGTTIDQLNFANTLGGENGFFNARVPTPAPAVEILPETKKRKRREHDKNAPKRALTPFFLFLQTARPKIADEMGPGHTAKEVQDEGGKRWRDMPQPEKDKWTEKYLINFARYKEQTRAYKAGLPIPEISDVEAKRLHEQNKAAGKTGGAGGHDSDTSGDDSDNDAPPAKRPEPQPKKHKAHKDASKKKTIATEPDTVLDPALRSPEKKKSKKASKGTDEAAETKKAASEATPKSDDKQKKKKRKSAAAEL